MARPSLKGNVAKPEAGKAAEVARRLAQASGAAQEPAAGQDEAAGGVEYENVSYHIHQDMIDLVAKLAALRLEVDKQEKRRARRAGEKPPQARRSASGIVREALDAYRPKIEAEIEKLRRKLGAGWAMPAPKAWLITAFLAAMPWAATAEGLAGNDLLAACSTSDDLAKAGFCAGYVIGLNEGFMAGVALPFMAAGATETAADANSLVSTVTGVCLPAEVESGQLLDVMILYLQGNPETRHLPARVLYLRALQGAFPCATP